MRLTDEQLEEGRNCLRNKNVDAFMAWIDQHKILIDRATVRETMGKAIELGMSNERVVGLFDKVFVGMDPQLDRKLAIIKAVLAVAVSLLILGGCLGGCVYLIKLVF
jgi:hypothetical protein